MSSNMASASTMERKLERIYGSPDAITRLPYRTVVTIGNFDGVHRGHQALLTRVVETAARLGAVPTAITFEPHPLAVLAPDSPRFRITTELEKHRLMEAFGIQTVITLPFSKDLANWKAAQFCGWLENICRLSAMVIGKDFALGHNREGDATFLSSWARTHQLELETVPDLVDPLTGSKISSGSIRRFLEAGQIQEAISQLGRSYTISGIVDKGEGIGHSIGFPTANLSHDPELVLPREGVYAGWARLGETTYRSAISIGHRPTLGGLSMAVEGYLLDCFDNFYDEPITLAPAVWLREQVAFPDIPELASAIGADVAKVKAMELPAPVW